MNDGLGGARGCVYALMFALPLWCLLAVVIVALVQR